MQRISTPSAVAALPAKTDAGDPGYYSNGSTETGAAATSLSADWFNTVQEEMMALLAAGGITASAENNAQVLAALQALFILKTALDTDGTLAANSDAKIATQKAIVTYVANKIATADVVPKIWAKTDTSTLTVSSALVSAAAVTLAAGTYRVRFTRSVNVTEATYGFQLYSNGTAIPGANCKLSTSSGGSDDSMSAVVELEGFITLAASTAVTLIAKYGVISGSGSLSDLGGGALTVERVDLVALS